MLRSLLDDNTSEIMATVPINFTSLVYSRIDSLAKNEASCFKSWLNNAWFLFWCSSREFCSFFFEHINLKIWSLLSRSDLNKDKHDFIPSLELIPWHQPQLQLVQNTAARILTATEKYEHMTPTGWPFYSVLILILLITFKVLNGLAPNYIKGLLTPRVPARFLGSVNATKVTRLLLFEPPDWGTHTGNTISII